MVGEREKKQRKRKRREEKGGAENGNKEKSNAIISPAKNATTSTSKTVGVEGNRAGVYTRAGGLRENI